ncbi:hypothetical protein [endosymbiont GvMRE of Glomus versiforme]|uniref:hypothetical protein n=1 Tax=endosymbiont GvMRE of Glomus versiforme TaxID=2039283 RepID=UPI000EEDA350|nr:hypothetical protein [endosymbiont GvMRE of Glomus versiforme]RHZ36889.1 hypothetical protein GvMRE_I2g338 [endosymbiont GvMRE of Glomus versiforme]
MKTTHKVNNPDELIAKVKEYANCENKKWYLKNFYIKNFGAQGVILKNNDNETAEIWTDNFENNGETAEEIFPNNIKKLATVVDFFTKNLESNREIKEQKDKEECLFGSFELSFPSNFEELKEKVKKYYQKHQKEIKQNPEFTNWIEIREGQEITGTYAHDDELRNKFYIYLGEKRKKWDKEFSFGIEIAIKTWGEIILYRDLEFICGLEKENHENLQKELQKYWNDLVNEKVNKAEPEQSEKKQEQIQKQQNFNNDQNKNGFSVALWIGVGSLVFLIGLVVWILLKKDKASKKPN